MMIRKIFSFLGVITICLSGTFPTFAQDTLTVMTYNIYHGEFHYHEGKNNLKGIASVINEIKPDLVALQEVDSLTGRSAEINAGTPVNQVKELGELTGMYDYFGKAIDFDGGGYGEGLLSRNPLNSKKIMLPVPEGGERRALVMVEYPLKGQQRLIFGGTHLCHQYQQNRIAQVQAINKYFSSVNQPAIIAGDFNFTPEEKPYHFIKQQWFDAALMADSVKLTYPFHQPSKRIDYIFLSRKDWKIIEIEVLQENYSDHMPVVLTVIVN